jgi:hypothetical protein
LSLICLCCFCHYLLLTTIFFGPLRVRALRLVS